MSGVIRCARWWDVRRLQRLQAACWPREYRSTGLEIARHTRAPWRTYVLEGAGSLLGALVVVEIDSLLIVDSVEVLPGERRRGVARALLRRALGDAEPEAVSYAVAHGVTAAGRRFLAAEGFVAGPTPAGSPTLYQRWIAGWSP